MTRAADIDVEAFKRFEQEHYSKVAQGYDQTTAIVTSQANDTLLTAVGARRGVSLLDVACGPGWLSAAAVKLGAVVTALDFAESMVAIARRRCPEAKVHNADAENLPFEASEFDAVVCNLGLLHLPTPERAIGEAFRVLKTGGCYAFTCWTPPARNPFVALILGSIQTHGNINVDLPAAPPPFRFGDPTECERVLSAAGFSGVSVRELPMVWPFPTPEDVAPMVLPSSARLGPTMAAQTSDQRRDIDRAIAEGARKYATATGIEIPSAVLLAVGRKPA